MIKEHHACAKSCQIKQSKSTFWRITISQRSNQLSSTQSIALPQNRYASTYERGDRYKKRYSLPTVSTGSESVTLRWLLLFFIWLNCPSCHTCMCQLLKVCRTYSGIECLFARLPISSMIQSPTKSLCCQMTMPNLSALKQRLRLENARASLSFGRKWQWRFHYYSDSRSSCLLRLF